MMIAKSPLIFLVVLAVSSCSSSPRRFDAVGDGGELGGEARVVLRSETAEEGSIRVDAVGRPAETVDGVDTDAIALRFVVENNSSDVIALELSKIGLTDDAGSHWRFYGMLGTRDGESQAGQIVIEPRSRRTVELLFEGGALGVLRSTGSVRAEWSYAFRGRSFSHQHRFLPRRVVVREYHEPYAPVFFYGSYHHGHYGYPYRRHHRGSHVGVGFGWGF
ncbi:MAG TPA: hypothetical protein PKA37_12825 [Planctomycetota bacterium]|jgi:hypothetical protein|nr:hypothetical protein [Planctomycetota bacterium]